MAVVGAGLTLDFGSGFTAQLISLSEPDEGRVAVDVTSADDVTKQFIPGGIKNPGRFEGSMNFDPRATPPDSVQTVTATYPDGSTKEASGFLTVYNAQMSDIEDRMTADFTIQLTGAVTRTPIP